MGKREIGEEGEMKRVKGNEEGNEICEGEEGKREEGYGRRGEK